MVFSDPGFADQGSESAWSWCGRTHINEKKPTIHQEIHRDGLLRFCFENLYFDEQNVKPH